MGIGFFGMLVEVKLSIAVVVQLASCRVQFDTK